jgi:NADPH:quinone reductase-like Zn-dependent oxidoreductase
MKAACVQKFGPPTVITIDDLPRPKPSSGQLLVRVRAAGVGPWDALVARGRAA